MTVAKTNTRKFDIGGLVQASVMFLGLVALCYQETLAFMAHTISWQAYFPYVAILPVQLLMRWLRKYALIIYLAFVAVVIACFFTTPMTVAGMQTEAMGNWIFIGINGLILIVLVFDYIGSVMRMDGT